MKSRMIYPVVFMFITIFGFTFLNFTYSNSAEQEAESQDTERKPWVVPEWADTLTNPVAGDAEATTAGKKIFETTCAVCHGKTGKGDGPGSKGLKPQPKNLTSEKVQGQSDGAIFWKITTGNLPMASYEKVYSEKERWQLVNFIRKLAEREEKSEENSEE